MVEITNGTPITHTEIFRETLTRLMARYAREQDPRLAVALFRALGWRTRDYRLETGGPDRPFRLGIAGETNTLLFIETDASSDAAIRRAVNVAYNSGVDWAAITDFGETRLVNSRWGKQPIHLDLKWRDYPQRRDELGLLSPEAIVDGRLAASAAKVEPDEHILRPVDEDLLARLQRWRRRLVQVSREAVDRQFHYLIGRLFFIRSCEDRGILERESLRTLAAQHPTATLGQALNAYFTQLDAIFRAELFDAGVGEFPAIEGTVLAGIIEELYTPFPDLPRYRYDFAYLNVDVLGAVYEQYVATELVRDTTPPSLQATLFGDDVPDMVQVKDRTMQHAGGIFYTPPYLVNYVIRHTVEPLLRQTTTLDELPRIADLSCGSGAFLTHAAERLVARARDIAPPDMTENWHRRVIPQLIGIDRDERAVALARVNLWILATMGEPPRPLPDLDHRLDCADALLAPEVDRLRGQLDAIVGNPPFLSWRELSKDLRQRLRQRYGTATGQFDLAYVFMERALQLVRPGGMVGFVIPNRIFLSEAAQYLREQIARLAIIERIVHFGHLPAFASGTSYIALLIVRKRAAADEGGAPPLTLYRLKHLLEPPSLQLLRADVRAERGESNVGIEVLHVPQPTDGAPWIWTTSAETDILAKLRIDAQPLGDVATIHQGIRTGNSQVFLLHYLTAGSHDGRWRLKNGLGQEVDLEPDLLRPAVYGRTSLAPGALSGDGTPQIGQRYLLYPYRDGTLLDWSRLAADFPATAAYLTAHRERLTGRRSIAGHRWYGLSKPRNPAWFDRPKLLTHELVRSDNFVADRAGRYAPVGAIALLPLGPGYPSIDLLFGVLNSSLAALYLRENAQSFKDGYAKILVGKLEEFPFPWAALEADTSSAAWIAALAAAITDRAPAGLPVAHLRDAIDGVLAGLLELSDPQREVLRDIVSRPADTRGGVGRIPGRVPPAPPDHAAALLALSPGRLAWLDPVEWGSAVDGALPMALKAFLTEYAGRQRAETQLRPAFSDPVEFRAPRFGPTLVVALAPDALAPAERALIKQVRGLIMPLAKLPAFVAEFRRVLAVMPPLEAPPPLEEIINTPLPDRTYRPTVTLTPDELARLLSPAGAHQEDDIARQPSPRRAGSARRTAG